MIIHRLFALLALLSLAGAASQNTLNASGYVIITTEIFSNILGSSSRTLTYTETIGVSVTPAHSGSPILTTTNGQNISFTTIYGTNITVTSTTVQPPTSTMTITVSSVQLQSTVTGLCYWGQQAILTPCTNSVLQVAASTGAASTTQKSPAVPLSQSNPFTPLVRSVKNILSFGSSSFKETRKVVERSFQMYGQDWDEDCSGPPMIYSPIAFLVLTLPLPFIIGLKQKKLSHTEKTIYMWLAPLLVLIMTFSTYAELYARPAAKLNTWWLKCRQPCALLTDNGAALYWASVEANMTAIDSQNPPTHFPSTPRTD